MYLEQTRPRRRAPMSNFTKTLLGLTFVNALLVLFLSFGAVFPSRVSLADPADALPNNFYDYSAKASPFRGSEKPKRSRTASTARPRPVTTASALYDASYNTASIAR